MFEQRYRADNDAIGPSPALVEKTAAAMRREAAARPAGPPPAPVKPRPRKRGRALRAVLAAAACVAVLFAAFPAARFFGSLALPRETVPAAESYRQIYGAVREIQRLNAGAYNGPAEWLSGLFGAFRRKSATNSPTAAPDWGESTMNTGMETVFSSKKEGEPHFSETNLQVAGVQEADVVKTDGRFLYIVSGSSVRIVAADKGQVSELARVDLPAASGEELRRPFELYVTKNRLIVLCRLVPAASKGYGETVDEYLDSMRLYDNGVGSVEAAIYDITDRKAPALLHTQGQSGSYLSSRMVGDALYLVTNHAVEGEAKRSDPTSYVPLLYTDGASAPLPAGDVALCPQPSRAQYIVATGLDTQKPDAHTASRAVMGGGANLYASTEALYVAVTEYASHSRGYLDVTTLLKFTLKEGRVDYAGTASVPGSLLNQFSMDEHKGYFRLVTTVDGGGSNLYVLDKELKTRGKLENVAPGERVYSVRFDGDIGYFVTFRQTDPLFTVDLADPAKPSILSALKIPGFSQYLHPYGDGLLFGLGKDADPETGAAGGLKLSMFDVSDPRNVTEKHTELLGISYADSEALANHKAILISREKNLIAFPATGDYLVYGYDETTGFTQRARLLPPLGGQWTRGLFIDDALYVCSPLGVTAYSLDNFEQITSLIFS